MDNPVRPVNNDLRPNLVRPVNNDLRPNPNRPSAQRPVSQSKRPGWVRGKWFKAAIIGLLIAALLVVGWYSMNAGRFIRNDRYQAVFLANGQVYFGKLQEVGGNYIRLSDIYYLQVQTPQPAGDGVNDAERNNQQNTDASNSPKLIKLGEELHSPEDEMLISKDQLLFWENLKDSGKVSDAIKDYKKSKE